jgi:hypothetical protein
MISFNVLLHDSGLDPIAIKLVRFWSRWEDYAASGHGGNERMLDLPTADYHVSIWIMAK